VKLHDGFFLPLVQPVVARDFAVVLVGVSVALSPLVELAFGDVEPLDELSYGQLGFLRPFGDKIDNRVAGIVGDPAAG
jgi:hypothetical protein